MTMIDAVREEILRYRKRNNLKPQYVFLGHVEYMQLLRDVEANRVYHTDPPPEKIEGVEAIRVAKENFFLVAGDYNAL